MRLGVQGCEQQRPPQPLIKGTIASHFVADPFLSSCPEQPHAGQKITRLCGGYAALCIENPPWDRPVAWHEPPAFIGSEIYEIENGMIGAAQGFACADTSEIGQCRVIARQHDMVAVVDPHPQRRIE